MPVTHTRLPSMSGRVSSPQRPSSSDVILSKCLRSLSLKGVFMKCLLTCSRCPVLLPSQFQEAGLQEVDEKVFVTLGRPDLTPVITRVALEYLARSLNGLLLLDKEGSLGLIESGVKSLVEMVTKETENGVEVGTNLHWVWGQNSSSL
ncbi:hypothetical protein QL093DRAFT_1073175 [Fusarium oxysporum]|nr:hypothetical protein QL093DRAFT_1073175 [Fusarium oxysporum]